MGIEIESKVLEIYDRKEDIIATLKNYGAHLKVDALLTAYSLQNQKGQTIRIREQINPDHTHEIHAEEKRVTQKGHIKFAKEIDHPVKEDFDETLNIYEYQGFEKIFFSIKKRMEYMLYDSQTQEVVKFAFDSYSRITGLNPGIVIPEFLEIESQEQDIVLKYALKLGIKEEELLDWGPKELIEHYNNG